MESRPSMKAYDTPALPQALAQFLLSFILFRLFDLILSSRYIPLGFKRTYIVPIPKPKDTHAEPMTCNDFRGIPITLFSVFLCVLPVFGE